MNQKCCVHKKFVAFTKFIANFNISPGGKFVTIITSLFARLFLDILSEQNSIVSRQKKSSVEISTDWVSGDFFYAKLLNLFQI